MHLATDILPLSPLFLVAPKLEIESKYQGIQQIKGGTRMTLNANMSGVPQPNARWFHNGNEVRPGDNVTIDTGKSHSTLNVVKTTKDNAGSYKVIAENSVGADSAEFTVDVKGEQFWTRYCLMMTKSAITR